MTEHQAVDQIAGPASTPPTPAAPPAPPGGTPRRVRLWEWLNAHARTIALVAVGVSFVVAGVYALVLGSDLRYFDEKVYVGLTNELAHGLGFTFDGHQPTAYRPPGYPVILLPVYLATGGSVLAMRFIGVLSLAGTVWFTYLIGRRAHSPATGALAALVVGVYPLLVYTATTLYPQVPALFMLLVMVEFGLRAVPDKGPLTRRNLWLGLVSGLFGGLLTLAVPTMGVTVVGLVAWLVWRRWRGVRRVPWFAVAVLVVGAAVLPTAWCVRNAVQLHAFIPVSTNNGINLLLGNSDHANADGGRVVDISSYEHAAADLHLAEADQDTYYTDQAMSWIAHHPGHAAALYGEKLANNFNYHNELATAGQNNVGKDLVSALTFYPILLLALLRVAFLRRYPMRPAERLVLGIIVGNVLLLAVFYTRLRFRVPLDGLTIVLAASMVTHWLAGRADNTGRAGDDMRPIER